MSVERWDEDRDGPVSEAALRARLERRGYTVSRYTYASGTSFRDHDLPPVVVPVLMRELGS